jgi:exosortase
MFEGMIDRSRHAAVEEVETQDLHAQVVAGIGDPGEREPRNIRTGITDPGYNWAGSCYTARILKATEQLSPVNRTQLIVGALALGTLWFLLCRQLSGEWSANDQYSYGWFVPFFAAFLFWLRWEDRPKVRIKKEEGRNAIAVGIAILALLVLFPVRLFEVANPDWRPLDWVHATAVVTLTLLVIWAAGGWAWVRHFAFPVCFFFVAVPWLSPIEEPIVEGLMRTVAAVATETLTLFGVPAQLEGNLIRVSSGLVGVNEACSGVRSLQTSLMIGLLFGELKRLSVAKRWVLVAGALAIAILANFGRAFFLVWIAATKNVAAVDSWHDVAGYAIVAAVFLGSLGLTALLAKGGGRRPEAGGQRPEIREHRPPTSVLRPLSFILSLFWFLAIEIGVEAWYRTHERGLIARERWTARWPESAKDFRDIHLDETTKRLLRFDEGRGATWRMQSGGQRFATANPSTGGTEDGGRKAEERGEEAALLYFFRWRPGGNSALLANLHRPDVCLPASGWVQIRDFGIRSYRVTENFSLPFRHFLFAQGGAPARQRFAHAFYCLREDRVRSDAEDSLAREEFAQEPSEWSRRERVSLVTQGRRHLGQQVMEFVLLSAKETPPQEAEAQFAEIVQGVVERK